jgi:hypothetical protein
MGVGKRVIGSREGGSGILARWVFSWRGEGGVWRSGGSVTPMQSEEEAMGHGARAGGGGSSTVRHEGGRGLVGHASGRGGGGRQPVRQGRVRLGGPVGALVCGSAQ